MSYVIFPFPLTNTLSSQFSFKNRILNFVTPLILNQFSLISGTNLNCYLFRSIYPQQMSSRLFCILPDEWRQSVSRLSIHWFFQEILTASPTLTQTYIGDWRYEWSFTNKRRRRRRRLTLLFLSYCHSFTFAYSFLA